MTHAELVERAARWLAGTRQCALVVKERSAWCLNEAPDAMGWQPRGHSILVECKTSVADFYADRRKPSRREPALGLGRERWYFTEPGLLHGRELPAGWGLIELVNERVRRVVPSALFDDPKIANHEIALLVAVTRRSLGGSYKGAMVNDASEISDVASSGFAEGEINEMAGT